MKHNGSYAQQLHTDPALKLIYSIVLFLCICMLTWILIAPASWLIERSSFHQNVLFPYLQSHGAFRVVPKEVVTKYQGHSLIHFTHILPGALWSAILPFQLNPVWREQHPKMHRLLGYVFAISFVCVTIGIPVILQRSLSYDYFFDELTPPAPAMIKKPPLWMLAGWFFGCGMHSIRMARSQKFQLHQKWMIRHVSSGIWVAAQRFIAFPICIAVLKVTHPPPVEISQYLQSQVFGGTGLAAMIICITLGEWLIHRISVKTREENVAKRKKTDLVLLQNATG